MSDKPFRLNPKQQLANSLLASVAREILLYGGSRSGKTFLIVRAIVIRALKAPKSRHISLRLRFGHIKSSIVFDTFPKVMSLCFPSVPYVLSKSDWFVRFPEAESEYWFAGLDDKERTEKILGNEYATIHLNECSQIPWESRNVAITRLAQLVYEYEREGNRFLPKVSQKALSLRMLYDENPPDKLHWSYKLFISKQDPDSKGPLPNPERYAAMQINPVDNQENLAEDYVGTLKSLSQRLQKRFLKGEFREAAPNALFTDEMFDKSRWIEEELPEMLRIVIAVDPSGADDDAQSTNAENDDIGIVVCGLGVNGKGYVLEDCTLKAGPATWGNVAVQAFERWSADVIVGEVNFGGAMVRHVIHSRRPKTPFRAVRASRGKSVRAEPISSLVEQGSIAMAGTFSELEEELCGMTTHGFVGAHSPNRADAMIWGFTDLFPSLLAIKQEKPEVKPAQVAVARRTGNGWMGQ
jgi:phage terminase large subunit-like protein